MTSPRFDKVAPVIPFPKLEAEIRRFWKEEDVFHRSLEQRKGSPRFTFYEGPPTANGLPHNGHVLTRVIKDLFPRYKTMRGYYAPRKAGWDTHGLPVEIEVEKQLRISGKQAIEDYGIEPFIRLCQESVFRYTSEWEKLTEDLGFWVDLENAYVTYHESYVQSVWWALSELFKKGLLYRGHKVVWWWAQGGTALSQAEVGEGYKEVDDPSIFVRFPLLEEGGGASSTSLLVWTTTPWTLPSNSFVAVKGSIIYAEVEDPGDDEGVAPRTLIMAEELVETLAGKVGRDLTVQRTFPGTELVGRAYQPPFDWFAKREAHDALWKIIDADFVEVSSGTGIVHIAPAFGEEDFAQLKKLQQQDASVPLLNAVLPDGGYDPEIAPAAYAGRWVKQADSDLSRELKEADLCWHLERVRHDYPFCVRSDKDPLIQYARPAWYIRTTDKIDDAIAINQEINWLPEHIKDGRFGDFLANNQDWALSRERFWGTPLNIWINDVTGAMDAPASVADILERNANAFDAFDQALAKDPDLCPDLRVHKPWIDEVTWEKPGEEGVYRRVTEVIDCWFDSGCMPFAQWGYPLQGEEEYKANFPADFISEAIDQTRGWFYSQLMVSSLLNPEQEGPHPYKTCLVLGHVQDRHGKKESKSKGNYTSPEVILDRVRMGFAVVEGGSNFSVSTGQAMIAREDYEGLDFRGESAQVQVYRESSASQALTLTLLPAKLPRRVIVLAEEDRKSLKADFAPGGIQTRPVEVPQLDDQYQVMVEDPSMPAPGADAVRWFFYASNPPWNGTRFSLRAVRELQRELPLKLRNVYSFFSIYAEIDEFNPNEGAFAKAGAPAVADRPLLDRWILSELALTVQEVRTRMDQFLIYESTQALSDFVDSLSNWYVRRSRARFWSPSDEEHFADKSAVYWTLYECLTTLAKLLAPFLPFATEEMWRNLRGPEDEVSVHCCDYPELEADHIDESLSGEMRAIRELVSLGLQVRTTQKLRVRQPLQIAEIVLTDDAQRAAIAKHLDLMKEELNVHEIHFTENADEFVTYQVKPNFRALGPRVGKKMKSLKAALADADGASLLRELQETQRIHLEVEGESFELSAEEMAVSLDAREGFAAASGNAGVVVLHTELTDALIEEGLFREVLNRVQTYRKELDLEYTDRIELFLTGSERILSVVSSNLEELKSECLVVKVVLGEKGPAEATLQEVNIEGESLEIGLLRA